MIAIYKLVHTKKKVQHFQLSISQTTAHIECTKKKFCESSQKAKVTLPSC